MDASVEAEVALRIAIAAPLVCVVALLSIALRRPAAFACGLLGILVSQFVPVSAWPPEGREAEFGSAERYALSEFRRSARHGLICAIAGGAIGTAVGLALCAVIARAKRMRSSYDDETSAASEQADG